MANIQTLEKKNRGLDCCQIFAKPAICQGDLESDRQTDR